MPFHVAHKKVPYCDEQGKLIDPAEENAYKFERFIFDALPLAERALVLETDRRTRVQPGQECRPATIRPTRCERPSLRLHRDWLRAAGAQVDDATPVEISPLFALDADEVRAKIKPGTRFANRRISMNPTTRSDECDAECRRTETCCMQW